ncbi:carboxypeptidase B-like [Venturia canescens]|uniref:carboxypeptidase B-like n=1 Tax=Venturia canescens TaxID=32260 RepID=UPI001C9D4E89|nr:carboxypeptidase B-like [Venturia canescens]
MMRISFLFIGALLAFAVAEDDEFIRPLEGMKGLSVRCDTEEKLATVNSYVGYEDFDFLSLSKKLGDEIKVLVAATSFDEFTTVLTKNQINHTVFIQDVLKEIENDYTENEIARTRCFWVFGNYTSSVKDDWLTFYPSYADIEKQLVDLHKAYKNITTLTSIGTSYEGRMIYGLKISSRPAENGKPMILIDAGMHAREWITPVTAMNIINQLVKNDDNRGLYEKVDWFIIPVLNPDGYEFSRSKRGNRLWKKHVPVLLSRTVSELISTGTLITNGSVGASENPCHDSYAGSKPYSEPESLALSDFMITHNETIAGYFSLRASAKAGEQFILYPWGWTLDSIDEENYLRELAIKAVTKIYSVREKYYKVGSIATVLNPEAGGSVDFAGATSTFPLLTYAIYLPAEGSYGYNPPQSAFKPIGIEIFEAFKVFGNDVATYTINNDTGRKEKNFKRSLRE